MFLNNLLFNHILFGCLKHDVKIVVIIYNRRKGYLCVLSANKINLDITKNPQPSIFFYNKFEMSFSHTEIHVEIVQWFLFGKIIFMVLN